MPAARAAVLSLLTLLGFCGSALGADRVMFEVSAEDTSPDTPTRAARELTDGKWHVSAEPSLWNVAPSGRFHLPQSGAGVANARNALVSRLNLDNPRFSPSAEINLTHGTWGASLRAFSFGASDRNSIATDAGTIGDISVSPGDRLSASLDFATIEAEAHWRFFQRVLGPKNRLSPSVDAVFGTRFYHTDWKVERLSPSPGVSEASESFLEPIAGIKGRLELYEMFSVDAQATFGYMPLSSHHVASWDIMVGFQWRPIENVGVQVGYRQLLMSLRTGDDAGDFRYHGALAGLYWGVVVRF